MDMLNAQLFIRKSKTLTNGLRVVVFERPGAPIALSLRIRMGASFDPEGKDGLAHFCEHMLVSGTEKFPTKVLAAKFIERLGGRFWASTGFEDLGIYMMLGDPADIGSGMMLLGEFSTHSLFTDEAVETERGAILSEIRIKHSSPQSMANARLHDLIYEGGPLGRMILGTKESVALIAKEDVIAYCKERLTASNSVLVVVGGISAEEVFTLAEENIILPHGSNTDVLNDGKMVTLGVKHRTVLEFPGMDEVHIALGYVTVPFLSSDAPALHVLAELLGGGRSSILTERLRHIEGLVYGIFAKKDGEGTTGEFTIETSSKKEDVENVLSIINEEILKIVEGGVTAEQLDFVKSKLLKSRRLYMETSYEWMEEYSAGILYDVGYSVIEFDKNVSRVTIEDVVRVTKKYLEPSRCFVSLAGGIVK